MKYKAVILSVMLIVGALLLVYSLGIGVMIGSEWYTHNASFPWHMNNYIVMDGQYAYSIFGLTTMAIGGLATGLAMAAFLSVTKTRKHILILVTAFFIAIAMSGLGFNTLDFMLGGFYWTNMQYPPPVMVPLIGAVDVWNFYFFFFVVPLWGSGFLIGSAASIFTFVYRPQKAAAHVAEKNFTDRIKPKSAGYIAESKASWRTRRLIKETFEDFN